MNLVFGQVPEENVGTEEHFTGRNANGDQAEFYFRFDMEEEGDGNGMIRITDTCGRTMPIDFDNLDELFYILRDIKDYREDRDKFTRYWTARFGIPTKG